MEKLLTSMQEFLHQKLKWKQHKGEVKPPDETIGLHESADLLHDQEQHSN